MGFNADTVAEWKYTTNLRKQYYKEEKKFEYVVRSPPSVQIMLDTWFWLGELAHTIQLSISYPSVTHHRLALYAVGALTAKLV